MIVDSDHIDPAGGPVTRSAPSLAAARASIFFQRVPGADSMSLLINTNLPQSRLPLY